MIEETGRYEPNNHHPLATRYEKRAANYRGD
jgi:hypothetical protein